MCINNLGLYKFLFFILFEHYFWLLLLLFFFFFFCIDLYLCFETAFKCLCFRIAFTFPYVDLFFFSHCLSFFCTKSWAMVPASFAVGSGPGTFVVVFC